MSGSQRSWGRPTVLRKGVFCYRGTPEKYREVCSGSQRIARAVVSWLATASGDGAVADIRLEAEVFSCAVVTVFARTGGDCASSWDTDLEGGMRLKRPISELPLTAVFLKWK